MSPEIVVGIVLSVVSAIAGVAWWMIRIALDIGRIRGLFESKIEQISNTQQTHTEQHIEQIAVNAEHALLLEQHSSQLIQHANQLTELQLRLPA